MKRAREDDFIDDYGSVWTEHDGSFSAGSQDSDGSDSAPSSPEPNSQDTSDEEPPNPALIQAGPRIPINAVGQIGTIQYIGGDPVYTPANRPGAGGRRSVVTLGPGGYVSRNSDADRSVLPAIVQAEAAYAASHTFKAGHLLNAEFGGAGDDADNLTILTTAANSAMRAFDNKIKDAIDISLKAAYTHANNMGIDVTTLGYGIQLTITTGTTFWSDNAMDAGYVITTGVTCVAAIVGEPNPLALEATLTNLYGAARVNNHANLMVQLTAAIADVQNEVAAANAVGVVANQ